MPVSHVLPPRRGGMTLLALTSFIYLIFAFIPLSAQTQTIQGPDLNNPAYASGNVYPYWGQCTWYAWGRAKENDNYALQHMGNAEDWKVNSQTPAAHSIAVWTNSKKGNGHVAYVEKVEGDDVWITEANYSNFRPGVSKNDDVGGGFDGCHIVTKKEMAQRGDLKLKGYITYPITNPPPSAAIQHTCTRGKALSIDKAKGFSYSQAGDQVTVTFKGHGFQQGAKVIAQGIGWSSDEVVVVSNTGDELVALLGVQDAATFTVAIQNPDMERSKSQELKVSAAPPVQVANVQPVPSQEPVSTPATAPDVPAVVIPSGQPPAIEPQTPAPAPEPGITQQSTGNQSLTIPPAQQSAGDSSAAQSPDQSATAQEPEQTTSEAAPVQPPAQTSGASPAMASMPPVLLRVSPRQHTPGQFTVDLWGANFQSGAKLIAQGNGWSSDQAAVTFLNPMHLQAIIVAQDPAQFTLAVQNPDAQTSSAYGFVVTPLQAGPVSNSLLPGATPAVPVNTPVSDPGSPQQPVPGAVAVTPVNTSANPTSGAASNGTPNTNPGVPGNTAPTPSAPAAPTSGTAATGSPTATRAPIHKPGITPNGGSSNTQPNANSASGMPNAPIGKPAITTANLPGGTGSNPVPTTNVSPRGPGNGTASASRSTTAPVLSQLTPTTHVAGRFSVDLYGSGFQPGAKLIAQGSGWSSDQAAVMYVGPDHLRAVIDAQNPSQFTVAVRNPDSQISVAYPFQVTAASITGTTKTGRGPNVTLVGPPTSGSPAAGGAPANSGSTGSTARPGGSPIKAPIIAPTPVQHTVSSGTPLTAPRPAGPVSNPQIQPIPIRPMPVTTPTPAQHSISSGPASMSSRPVAPIAPISKPQIQSMPTQAIKAMPSSPPTPVAYPPSNGTNKPVLRPPSPANTPLKTAQPTPPVPSNRPVIPASPPVTTGRPAPTQVAQPRPTPTPVLRPQPQPAAPPVRVMPQPVPARVYTPPPPPPHVAPQPTPTPQPTKSPTPKKP